MPGVSADEFRHAMASFAAGVTLVTTVDEEGRPFGLTATAFSSVSKSPPVCLVCVSHDAEAHPALLRTRRFAVNLLAENQSALSTLFATHGADKFAGLDWEKGSVTGCPLVPGAIATVECTVQSVTTSGDHDVILGAIESTRVSEGSPLVYFRGRYADLRAR